MTYRRGKTKREPVSFSQGK